MGDPARWRQLGVLALTMVLSMTTWFSTAAVLPQLRTSWQLSDVSASFLTIAVQVGFVVGAIGSATLNLADRIPARRFILLGSVGAAGANVAILLADGLALALPARFLVGISLAGVYPPTMKAMSCWFRSGRGFALGVMVGALTLGSAVPHLIRTFGDPPWETVIVATSLLTVAGGLLAELVAKDGPHQFPAAPFNPKQLGEVLKNRRLRLATLGYFGHMWELYAMWAWIGVFALDVLDGQPQKASLLAFAVIGVGSLGSVAGGLISDRFGRASAAGMAMAASGLVAAVIGFLANAPTIVVVVLAVVWGFWVVADSAQFSTIVTEVSDQRYVGTALTVQLALGFVLTVVTIFLVPIIRDAANWGWAFVLLVPGPLLGVVAMKRLAATA